MTADIARLKELLAQATPIPNLAGFLITRDGVVISERSGGLGKMSIDTQELRRLLNAATPGDWEAAYPCTVCLPMNRRVNYGGDAILIAFTNRRGDAEDEQYPDDPMPPQDHANAELIAAMKNALPSLLAEVERDRKDAERWRFVRGHERLHVVSDDGDADWLCGGGDIAPEQLDAAIDAAMKEPA